MIVVCCSSKNYNKFNFPTLSLTSTQLAKSAHNAAGIRKREQKSIIKKLDIFARRKKSFHFHISILFHFSISAQYKKKSHELEMALQIRHRVRQRFVAQNFYRTI
jgi:hypothetical protein